MTEITKIEIDFPVGVQPPWQFFLALLEIVDGVCEEYELSHPDRVMWPAGYGQKIIWRELEKLEIYSQVFHINVVEREDKGGEHNG